MVMIPFLSQKLTILALCFFGFFCVEIIAKFNNKINKISRIYIGNFFNPNFFVKKWQIFARKLKKHCKFSLVESGA